MAGFVVLSILIIGIGGLCLLACWEPKPDIIDLRSCCPPRKHRMHTQHIKARRGK